MKKEEITKEEFVTKLKLLIIKYDKSDLNKCFTVKGGRGFTYVLQKLLINEINDKLVAPSEGAIYLKPPSYLVKGVFITDIGWVHIEYDNKFDSGFSREINQEIINGLPETCYNGELFDNENKSLGFITVLKTVPYQNLDDLITNLKNTFSSLIQDFEDYKSTITNTI